MPKVLLDHPWNLADSTHLPGALKQFNDWIRKTRAHPIPFFSRQDYDTAIEGMAPTGHNAWIARIAYDYIRTSEGTSIATPAGGARGNSYAWCSALSDAIGDGTDWRIPQIAYVQERRQSWPDSMEIPIERDGTTVGDRVIYMLEDYDTHPHAISDFDPWDLSGRFHRGTDGRLDTFPCLLPKHPELVGVPLEDLREAIDTLCRHGWMSVIDKKERHFYYPPSDLRLDISKHDWRVGSKCFPHAKAAGGKGSGWQDRWGRVWIWDRQKHTHWDVEFPTRNPEDKPEYWVISHTGELIKKGA